MIVVSFLVLCCNGDLVRATSSSSSSSKGGEEEPIILDPDLPFGDINLIVLTDVHSWIGGHKRNGPSDQINGHPLDVTYGDVVSFYERLKLHCDGMMDQDLFLVQNGDWIDGTGLAMDGDPSHLVPLIEKIPFDVLNTGNHELYRSSVIEYMAQPGGFIEWWGHRHLASNVYFNDTDKHSQKTPLSNHYTMLHGKHSTILVFGFLYNLPNPSDLVYVQPVEEAVKESWFRKALEEESYDAILVMLHAGHDDPSLSAIHETIRYVVPNDDMPIQFIAGHTHYRRHAIVDPASTVVEAGRFLDTIGWVSFPNAKSVREYNNSNNRRMLLSASSSSSSSSGSMNHSTTENTTSSAPSSTPYSSTTTSSPSSSSTMSSTATEPSTGSNPTANPLFQYVFLDANVATLEKTLGIIPPYHHLETPYGKEVSAFIERTQQDMGLERKVGCAPKDYYLNVSMDDSNSLWRLYRDEVVPHELVQDGTVNRAILVSQGCWRYDLYGGDDLTYDDVIAVSPFNEPVYLVGTIPGHLILKLNEMMNDPNVSSLIYLEVLPEWILAGQIRHDQDCELYAHHFGLPKIQDTLRKIYPDLGDATETNLTSTSIWLSFVADQWACPGGILNNPWVTNVNSTIHNNSQTTNTLLVALVVILVLSFILVCCRYVMKGNCNRCFPSCCCCCCWSRSGNYGKDYGEMEVFSNDSPTGEDNDTDYGNNGTKSMPYGDNHDDDDDNYDEPPVRIV